MKPHDDPPDPDLVVHEPARVSNAAGTDCPVTSATSQPVSSQDSGMVPAIDHLIVEGRKASDYIPLVYDELRRLAARRLAGESREHTLQPTALVHEVWLRVVGAGDRTWQDRQHFFATAAEAMRRILVDRARRRLAVKRGSDPERLEFDDLPLAAPDDDDRLLAMNEALERFATVDARKAELVRLRYFAGLNFEEAAEVLAIAVPTAKQWMAYARAWLKVEITRPSSELRFSSPSDPGIG
ncbi:MAG: sigma-70 family RNA polymerase sigma factor [Verrucomicrobiales bacterium]|nr:sigma-70 family RNA polymerase sigma factor [Verrucomicrobiales bacterium]